MTKDLKYALRRLSKNPGFTLVAAMTLALGIGANVAIYTVSHHTLFAPLPYPDPERTVVLGSTFPEQGWEFTALGIPEIMDQDERNPLLEDMAMFSVNRSVTVAIQGRMAERLHTTWVTSGYFSVLGAQAALGRTFLPEEDEGIGAHPVAVVSDRTWRTRFSSDPNVLGTEVGIGKLRFTVVGVMPPDFRDLRTAWGDGADIWLPLSMGTLYYRQDMFEKRETREYHAVARLAAGKSLEEVQSVVDSVARQLEEEYPEGQGGRGVNLKPLPELFFGDLEKPLLILQSAALVVLLICCVNVATLLMARARARRSDFGMKAALGASRARLTREMLVESFVLAGGGGVLGILLAVVAVAAFSRWGMIGLPSFVVLETDAAVFASALAMVVLTAIVFGIAPGFLAGRTDPMAALREGGRGGPSPLRGLFPIVALEVGLAVVLLIGAGLLIRSFYRFVSTDVGFATRDLVTMRLIIPEYHMEFGDEMRQLADRFVSELHAIPGVESASLWGMTMIGESGWHMGVTRGHEDPKDPENWVWVQRMHATPEAFDTLDIPILAGRTFSREAWAVAEDRNGNGRWEPEEKIASSVVVSETLAEKLWPGRAAVGQSLWLYEGIGWPATVVGVAADGLHRGRRDTQNVEGDLYLSYFQWPANSVSVIIKSRLEATGLAQTARTLLDGIDPELVIYDVATLEERLSRENAHTAFPMVLMGFYAATATLLAAVGIFGVLAFSIRQRTSELAIRAAMGARRANLLTLVLSQGMKPVVVGLAAGLGTAFLLGGKIRDLLYAIPETDVLSWLGASLFLLLVAFLACLLPARRASRQDPMNVLRQE